jgi:O-antigen/teichoic acid export membrane protein
MIVRFINKLSGPRSITYNASVGIVTDIVSIPLIILAGVIVARWLGPEQRGVWALLLTVNVVLAQLLSFGVPLAMPVLTAKRSFDLKRIHTIALLFAAVVGLLGVLLYLAFQPFLHGTVLRGSSPDQALIAVLLFPLTLYGIMWDGIVTGLQEIQTLNLYKLLQVVVNLINPVLALVLLDAGLTGMVIVWLIGAVIITVTRAIWLFQCAESQICWDAEAAQSAIGFGAKIYPAFLMAALLGQMDVLFLNYFQGGRELGYYAVAAGFTSRVDLLGAALTTAANARLTSGGSHEVALLLASLLRRILAAGLIMIVLLGLFASPIIVFLYGLDYAPAALPFVALLFAAVIRSFQHVLAIHVVNHRQRSDIAFAFGSISFLIGVILFAVLIPKFGAFGCAVAVTLVTVSQAALYLGAFLRSTSLSVRSAIVWHGDDWQWLLSLYRRASFIKPT